MPIAFVLPQATIFLVGYRSNFSGCNARMDASTESRGQNTNASIAFCNVQSLQYQCDLIYDAISALQSNIGVLQGLKALRRNTNLCSFNCGQESCRPDDDRLQFCISRFGSCLKWAECLLEQAKQVSNLVRTSPVRTLHTLTPLSRLDFPSTLPSSHASYNCQHSPDRASGARLAVRRADSS